MRIVKLEAENLKRLRAVEITPEGDLVVISGRNGQGKTSVLDAIWFALGGAGAQRETQRPIRDGEDHASVTLDLGDLVVTRTWKGESSSLKVLSKDGASYSSPQKMLDGLVGRLSFDPLEFSKQDAKDQVAILLGLVDVGIDLDELAAIRRGYYEDRTGVNRQAKAVKAQLDALPTPDEDLPEEPLSAGQILIEQREHQRLVEEAEGLQRDFTSLEMNILRRRDIIAGLEARLAEQRETLAAESADLEAIADRIKETPVLEDIDFAARLEEVEYVNGQINLARRREELQGQWEHLVDMDDHFSDKIDAIELEKDEALRAAKMPIPGLGFDEDGVTYQGIPFAQCSAAEQLRVSMAMAMAMNPKLRVIRILDGSLLDSANMALIGEMARDNDYQVWVERVDESGEVGVVIEDGEVRK